MEISSISGMSAISFPASESSDKNITEENIEVTEIVNLDEEIINSSEEMADLISVFSRSFKGAKKKDNIEGGLISSMLEDEADEKVELLINQTPKCTNKDQLLNFARSMFPHDCDLMAALKELLLSRRLSELQKKKVKEAIADLEKFADKKSIQSGINIGKLAKRFSITKDSNQQLTAKDLRNSYLRFITLELPSSLIYQDWIDQYGCENRKRLLSFTLSSLVTDMKSNQPGIHSSEFGPLSSKLIDTKAIQTLDDKLINKISDLPFWNEADKNLTTMRNDKIVRVYLSGLMDIGKFGGDLRELFIDFMSSALIKNKATVLQTILDVYSSTPEYLYLDEKTSTALHDFILSAMTELRDKERKVGIWNEYLK